MNFLASRLDRWEFNQIRNDVMWVELQKGQCCQCSLHVELVGTMGKIINQGSGKASLETNHREASGEPGQ